MTIKTYCVHSTVVCDFDTSAAACTVVGDSLWNMSAEVRGKSNRQVGLPEQRLPATM